jgi:hypothetical protein
MATPTARTPRSATKKKNTVAKLDVERIELSKLLPHEKNPRVHPEKGSAEWNVMKKSLAHDYFDPLVWNKKNGKLVSGHFRVKVMEEMGITEADVVVVNYDEKTHLARLLAANSALGKDDTDARDVIIKDLFGLNFEMAITGLDPVLLEGLGEPPGSNGTTRTSSKPPAGDVSTITLSYSAADHTKVMNFIRKVRTKEKTEGISETFLAILRSYAKTEQVPFN